MPFEINAIVKRVALGLGAAAIVVLTAKGAAVLTPAARASDIPSHPGMPMGPSSAPLQQEYSLTLHHLHTGEDLKVVYRVGAEYEPDAVEKLNHFLRDHRTMDDADYDTREFDLLHALLVKLHRPNGVIDIVCGYRTPESNSYLRSRSAFTGVAEHSQHMLSKAIDIRVPGVSTLALRNAALSLGMGGVGYYPSSKFVHVDVGPVREWSFGGAPARGRRRRHRG